MTSTRLPGKVLKRAAGQALLQHHIDRLKWSGLQVVVATTENDTDKPIVDFCNEHGLLFYRGSENDVLSRFFLAAEKYQLSTIIRVTSDCPLVDGHLIKSAAEAYAQTSNPFLYTSNVLQRTFPRGLDFEIFSFERLKKAHTEATKPEDREHVTPYLHQNRDGLTQFKHILDSENLSEWRLTVDTSEDFELISRLLEDYNCADKKYSEIKKVLKSQPQLMQINRHIEQKKI